MNSWLQASVVARAQWASSYSWESVRWGRANGRGRGSGTGVPAAGAFSLPRLPPPSLRHFTHMSKKQERQGGGNDRNLCVSSQLSITLVPPFCLSFQMTQIPSNFLPQECRWFYDRSICIKLQSYLCSVYQGVSKLMCIHLSCCFMRSLKLRNKDNLLFETQSHSLPKPSFFFPLR